MGVFCFIFAIPLSGGNPNDFFGFLSSSDPLQNANYQRFLSATDPYPDGPSPKLIGPFGASVDSVLQQTTDSYKAAQTTAEIGFFFQNLVFAGAGMVSGSAAVTTNRGTSLPFNQRRYDYIPRDSKGNPIPLPQQRVNDADIPTPLPEAQGRDHTSLGGRYGTSNGLLYRQSATFSGNTNPPNYGQVPLSRVDWTNHGRGDHTNPHQHAIIWDYSYRNGSIIGRWITGSQVPF